MAESQQFCTFFLEGHFFGVPVQQVQEVIRYQDMTPAPLVADAVRGLINLRGQIVTAVDLRRCLSMPDRAPDQLPMNVVIRTNDGAVSLLVDEIGDVLQVPADSYEPPPDNMPREQREIIDGVYKLEGKLLLVLNSERVLQTQAHN